MRHEMIGCYDAMQDPPVQVTGVLQARDMVTQGQGQPHQGDQRRWHNAIHARELLLGHGCKGSIPQTWLHKDLVHRRGDNW